VNQRLIKFIRDGFELSSKDVAFGNYHVGLLIFSHWFILGLLYIHLTFL